MLDPEITQAYRATRGPETNLDVLCHAPFVSLNFEQNGQVTTCCYNRSYVLGSYPAQTLHEIWNGSPVRRLRQSFHRNEEAEGCDACFHQLKSRNFGGVLMRNFDPPSRTPDYRPEIDVSAPRMLEFEIANTCNLECVMCSGNWSSTIRARRENLPPLKNPYDRSFVEQLDEFLPGIYSAKFLGGEPFLIKRYYEIWERLRQSNPDVEISITTNASVLPDRGRSLLEELRAHIIVSLDALTPGVYEKIRRNAHFEKVMANVEYFLDYTKRRGRELYIAVCPMTHNWRELPKLLAFCEERGLEIYLNTVFRPHEASLGALPPDELADVIRCLEASTPAGEAASTRVNRQRWEGLLSQLRGWEQQTRDFDARCSELASGTLHFARSHSGATDEWSDPQGPEQLIPTLALSLEIARERPRRQVAHTAHLLPPTPLVLGNGRPPSTEDLLLATHLLCRYVDQIESGQPGDEELLKQQEQLRRMLSHRGRRDGRDEEWRQEVDVWIRERIQEGEADRLLLWMRKQVQWLAMRVHWMRGLEEGLPMLREEGIDEEGCRKVATYFEDLVDCFGDPWEGAEAGRYGSSSRSFDSLLPVRDWADLRRLMDAIYLFHRCYEPGANHAAFRRRIDTSLAAAVGNKEVALLALSNSNPAEVYKSLVQASDAELQRHIDSVR